ncbi:MAG: 50S ribosomal protein L17 [Planctomycetota bacterium]
MRHKIAGRTLGRKPAHHEAMRRNLAQSLFQYGEVQTTLIKAKEVRSFVEKLITLARKGTLRSRQRVISILNDRSVLSREEQEQYDGMTTAQQERVLVNRSGRRHRTGVVPASYNKKTYPFVARSVVHVLMNEIAPRYKDRPGGYTRIIRLAKRRVGDGSDLAVLQLVGSAGEQAGESTKKMVGRRRQRTVDRIAILEGKQPKRRPRGGKASGKAAPAKTEGDSTDAAGTQGT